MPRTRILTAPDVEFRVQLPSVAVILATRDRPALLADALRSAIAQQPPPRELRVANAGDTPIEDVLNGPGLLEVTIIPVARARPAAARNRAAEGAGAEVLAFLDDDDLWLPGHLAGLAAAFRDPAVALAFRDCDVVRERVGYDGVRRELGRRTIARDWDTETMRINDFVPPSAMAIRRSAFERLGGFDESFGFSEDWDFLLRAAAESTPRRIPGVTVQVRMRGTDNLSADRGPQRQACLDRLSDRHGLPRLAIKTFWEVAYDLAPERTA